MYVPASTQGRGFRAHPPKSISASAVARIAAAVRGHCARSSPTRLAPRRRNASEAVSARATCSRIPANLKPGHSKLASCHRCAPTWKLGARGFCSKAKTEAAVSETWGNGSGAPRARAMRLSWPGRKAMLPLCPGTMPGSGSARSGSGGLSETIWKTLRTDQPWHARGGRALHSACAALAKVERIDYTLARVGAETHESRLAAFETKIGLA